MSSKHDDYIDIKGLHDLLDVITCSSFSPNDKAKIIAIAQEKISEQSKFYKHASNFVKESKTLDIIFDVITDLDLWEETDSNGFIDGRGLEPREIVQIAASKDSPYGKMDIINDDDLEIFNQETDFFDETVGDPSIKKVIDDLFNEQHDPNIFTTFDHSRFDGQR